MIIKFHMLLLFAHFFSRHKCEEGKKIHLFFYEKEKPTSIELNITWGGGWGKKKTKFNAYYVYPMKFVSHTHHGAHIWETFAKKKNVWNELILYALGLSLNWLNFSWDFAWKKLCYKIDEFYLLAAKFL